MHVLWFSELMDVLVVLHHHQPDHQPITTQVAYWKYAYPCVLGAVVLVASSQVRQEQVVHLVGSMVRCSPPYPPAVLRSHSMVQVPYVQV